VRKGGRPGITGTDAAGVYGGGGGGSSSNVSVGSGGDCGE